MQPESRTPVDGGPAFPGVDWTSPQLQTTFGPHGQPMGSFAVPSLAPGMSLRDLLAAVAMHAEISATDMGAPVERNPGETIQQALQRTARQRAEFAYRQADAMLAARSKPAAAP